MILPVAAQILEALGPSCRDSLRRQLLVGNPDLNGIDFVEFEQVAGPPVRHVLHVHFVNAVPAGGYGLFADPAPLRVLGGTRIVGISVTKAAPASADPKNKVLDVDVDAQGDFSPYLLTVGWSRDEAGDSNFDFPGIDRPFSVAPVNFRPGCPVDFDCAPVTDCPVDQLDEPALDYLARDYASFRQMLIDLVAQRNPNWVEQSPADLGIALLELFAYEGDQLSYFQDAVANEAYLDTSRQRLSAKRHAKLVDYQMHDGRNAWTFVHLKVSTGGSIQPGQQVLTKIKSPMLFDHRPGGTVQPSTPPGVRLNVVTDKDYLTDPALAQVRVFETANAVAVTVDPLGNEIRLHSWGSEECCLPVGSTTVHLYAVDLLAPKAVRPLLKAGDHLLLEEVLGPETGAAADADPSHRQVVRITRVVATMHDPLFLADIDVATNEPKKVTVPVPLTSTLPLVQVTWATTDALTFPLCLSSKLHDARSTRVPRVSVARANIVVADHGRTVPEDFKLVAPLGGDEGFRLRLGQGPLTMQCEPPRDRAGHPAGPGDVDLTCDVHDARPAVAVETVGPGPVRKSWSAVPDLLASSEIDNHFVVDVDDVGRAVLRFGDGQYGARPIDVGSIEVTYRVGNGSAGNIGADALAHIVVPFPVPALWPTIEAVRNPLPANGGVDPELIEQVRQYAPAAFRAKQFRAVTEQDYVDAALTISGVSGAVANFRWTGSWFTVFAGIDPTDPSNVLTDVRGVTRLDPDFGRHVHDSLSRYRLAGYDLEIRSARYVPMDIAIHICAKPGYFAADVAHAVALALGAGRGPGTHGVPGLFDPSNLTFGQPVYLSRIYAAVENVDGVESATVTQFHRHGRPPSGELESGRLPVGDWEIARLDNDRSNMENGTLTLTAGGGS